MPQPNYAEQALNIIGLDEICDRILGGESVRQLCGEFKVGVASFWRWVSLDAERSARVKSARQASAASIDEKALEVLQDNSIPVDRAREIASHMRWQARVRDPRQFGEKLELSGELALNNLSADELDARAATLAKQIAEASAIPPLPIIPSE